MTVLYAPDLQSRWPLSRSNNIRRTSSASKTPAPFADSCCLEVVVHERLPTHIPPALLSSIYDSNTMRRQMCVRIQTAVQTFAAITKCNRTASGDVDLVGGRPQAPRYETNNAWTKIVTIARDNINQSTSPNSSVNSLARLTGQCGHGALLNAMRSTLNLLLGDDM